MRNYERNTDDELREISQLRGLGVDGGREDWIRRLQMDDYPGRVEVPSRQDPPQISSLVQALDNRDDRASDAIVVRGYLGRSDLLHRVVEYLERAREAPQQANAGDVNPREALRQLLDSLGVGEGALPEDVNIDFLIGAVRSLGVLADTHIPWRLYLTPRLDRYVDFHFNSMLAYRQEPKAERQDACTVWLRLFERGGRMPIPYRVVQVTNLGPSYGGWLGGELVEDYLDQPGPQSTAWGGQSGVNVGNRPWTTVKCGE